MAYGQKNYLEIQGINGKYRISQIGCFLTAFSNLMTDRFNKPIDPLGLNAAFRDRGIYIDVDDGIRDDLGWGSICGFDPNIVVAGSVTKGIADRSAGWPSSDRAIVRFYYRSVQTGQMITHFCLVANSDTREIIDSWDGVRKVSPYGDPSGWAVYEDHTPVPVVPAPTPDPNFVYIKAEEGFGISHLAKAAGYPEGTQPGGFGSTIVWDRIAQANGFTNASQFHVKLDVTYRVPRYKAEDYAPPAPVIAPPAPDPAPQPTPIPEPVLDPPKDEGEVIPVVVDPLGYKKSFEDHVADYVVSEDATIHDLDGKLEDQKIFKGQPVHSGATVIKGGKKYILTRTSVLKATYYGIPEEVLDTIEEHDALNLSLADEARKALGNFTRAEKIKNFFEKIKRFLLRHIARVEVKQNNKGA